jgi:putative polyketide hydroxylase
MEGMSDPVQLDIGHQYQSSAIIAEPDRSTSMGTTARGPWQPSGMPGERVPHVGLVGNGDRADRTIFDVLAGETTILVGPECRVSGHRVVRIDTDLIPDSSARARFTNQLGIADSGAVLVRPDGVIAWRMKRDATTTAANEAARLSLHRITK